jgi:predicted dehydrogenase
MPYQVVEGTGHLRYGLIGPGAHATEQLLPALMQMDGAELVAVAARDLERARVAACRWGAPRYTDDWSDMLDPEEMDAVIVATTPETHAEVIALCLDRGVSVFAEKPPAPSTTVLEQLVAAEQVAPSGVVAFVGFNFPYGTSYAKLRDALSSHGEIRSFEIRMVSSKPLDVVGSAESVEESLLLGMGLHAIDMALRAMGYPASVDVMRATIDDKRMAVKIGLGYEDGRLATIHVGNHSNRLEYRCEIVTASGTSGVLDQHNTLTLSAVGRSSREAALDVKETVQYAWPSRRGGYSRTGYLTALESFHSSVAEGCPSTSSLAASLESYRILDRVLGR